MAVTFVIITYISPFIYKTQLGYPDDIKLTILGSTLSRHAEGVVLIAFGDAIKYRNVSN